VWELLVKILWVSTSTGRQTRSLPDLADRSVRPAEVAHRQPLFEFSRDHGLALPVVRVERHRPFLARREVEDAVGERARERPDVEFDEQRGPVGGDGDVRALDVDR